jgi:eukaryotic-like serine/threonine-protein kinase
MHTNTVYGGDFRILAPLCAGGMGKVYLAEQRSTGKRRAVKLMATELVSDPKMREHFVLEAHAASIVDSEHVVEVVAAGVEPETNEPWLAMELLEGEDLGKRVERALPSLTEIAEIVAQLGHGLGAAHAHGLVHRDLKPDNVFVAAPRREGVPFTVKVLDFGIASLADRGSAVRASRSIGTPLWMAPEQATLDVPITAATDIWALGLIGYYLFTGRIYWRSATADACLRSLLTEVLFAPLVPASWRAREQGVAHRLPRGFDRWFATCVARDPKMRFPDARIATKAFLDMLRGPTPVPAMVVPPRVMRGRMEPSPRRLGLYACAVACGLIGAAASAVPIVQTLLSLR